MTARPIRYQRQVSDRKGKIFYTSITSLSHISKITRGQAAHGGWRYCNCGTDGNSAAYKPVFLSHGSDSRQDN